MLNVPRHLPESPALHKRRIIIHRQTTVALNRALERMAGEMTCLDTLMYTIPWEGSVVEHSSREELTTGMHRVAADFLPHHVVFPWNQHSISEYNDVIKSHEISSCIGGSHVEWISYPGVTGSLLELTWRMHFATENDALLCKMALA
jgi:hypothetical protein